MPYVHRDERNLIDAVFAAPQQSSQEFLADSDPQITEFYIRMNPFINTISDRQFYQALALKKIISKDAALAAVTTGTIPEPLASFVANIKDPDQQFAARMLLSGGTEFRRDHPLIEQFAKELGFTPSQVDDIWRVGEKL